MNCTGRLARLMLLPLFLMLASCNESASDKLPTHRIVLNGDLLVDGAAVRMKAAFGKEDSSVVVVLEGGDTLRAGNGSSEQRMDFTSDLFGSYYRAAFALDTATVYATTLTRAVDGSILRSTFPPLPVAFAITAPLAGPAVSLAATPVLDVRWDVVVGSDDLAQDSTITCDWQVNPPPATAGGPVRRADGHYQQLTSPERLARHATVDLQARIDLQRAALAVDYPGSTVALIDCEADVVIYAKNRGPADPALSPYSDMSSRRTAEVHIRVVP